MSETLASPRIEVLFFDGCRNVQAAEELVERVADALGIDGDVRRVFIESPEAAQRARFLGSPSIRVNGHDIEPGADARTDFSYGCRVYQTPFGGAELPSEEWLREALTAAVRR
jgi:hypothetical protein